MAGPSLTKAQRDAWAAVESEPGVTVRQAALRLGVAHSTASYHLRLLVRRRLVETVRDGRHLRHYPAGTARAAQLAALLRDGRARLLLAALARPEMPSRSLNGAARDAGLPFGAAKRLLEQCGTLGLVHVERRGYRYAVRPAEGLRGLRDGEAALTPT